MGISLFRLRGLSNFKDYIYVVLIIVWILVFPTSGVSVSPTALYELGRAYHMDGKTEMAEACYLLVLEFEDHFESGGIHLHKYERMASKNLRTIKTNEAMKNIPLFRRGK